LIARAALERRESRGPHRRSDFPVRQPQLDGIHVVFGREGSPRTERWT
jgi:succinate dehydrogenase/fumarate reductase flavoprotein subunit